jgi:hypothetical protein
MAETGWPLIPRDALPPSAPADASAPVTKGVRRVPVSPHDAGRQLSIFGAETTEPSPFDLAGLLAGPGRLDRMGGTARVSVRVDAGWRVHVLVAELVTRGLVVTWRPVDHPGEGVRGDHSPPEPGAPAPAAGEDVNPVPDHGPADEPDQESAGRVARLLPFEVRTAYSSRLNALARAWPAAADQLFLSGPRMRLWVAAAGRPVDGGYALGLDPGDPVGTVDAALRRAGLAGVVSDHGLDYLISGRKRLHRLAELVGDRPAAAPEALWPGGATA